MSTTYPTDAELTDGLLTDDEFARLGRIKAGLFRIEDAIQRVNALAIETGQPMRLIDTFPVALMGNDISIIVGAHERAEKRIAAAARAAVESRAA